MVKTIAVVGAGRVGQTLARGLCRRGYRLGAVVTTHLRTARAAVRFIAAGKASTLPSASLEEAAIVIVATADRQVANAARHLARSATDWRGKVVLHTSGALSSGELAPLRRRGAAVGSLHPIYPFPRPLRSLPRGIVFGVEGDPPAVKQASRLARSLGGKPMKILAEQKRLYHAAAVFAAGHLMTVLDLGAHLLERAGVPKAVARQALLPLAEETLKGYARWGERAWTGPLSRGDVETVRHHLAALKQLPPPYRQVYLAVARAGLTLYGDRSHRARPRLRQLLQA